MLKMFVLHKYESKSVLLVKMSVALSLSCVLKAKVPERLKEHLDPFEVKAII